MKKKLIFTSDYIPPFLTPRLPLITQGLYSSVYIYTLKLYLIKENQTLSKHIETKIWIHKEESHTDT